jgi:hypothetical protein
MVHLSAINGCCNLNMHQRMGAVVCKSRPYHPPTLNGKAAYSAGIVVPERVGDLR